MLRILLSKPILSSLNSPSGTRNCTLRSSSSNWIERVGLESSKVAHLVASTDLTRCHATVWITLGRGPSTVKPPRIDPEQQTGDRDHLSGTGVFSMLLGDSPTDEDSSSQLDLRVAPHAQCPPAT